MKYGTVFPETVISFFHVVFGITAFPPSILRGGQDECVSFCMCVGLLVLLYLLFVE